MRKLKLSFTLILMVLAFGCGNQDLLQDTQPQREVSETFPSTFPDEDPPGPVPITIIIAIDYPRGFDRDEFRDEYGPQMGLTILWDCPSNPARELWMIDYKTEEEFETMLNQLFYQVNPPGTQSNGDGGYQSYVKYNSSSSSGSSSNNSVPDPGNFILIPVDIYYDSSCD